MPPASEFPLADLYLCWDRDTLYLGVFAQDILEEAYYRDRIVPKPDRMQWIVRAGAGGLEVRARLGADREPICSDPAIRITNLSGMSLIVRNVAVMELPAGYFGRARLRAGDAVDLDVELITHCQAYHMRWRGTYTLAR